MKTKLIAVTGKKGSGKDTVISMIHYINTVGTIASYEGWVERNASLTGSLSLVKVAFADPLKDILATMFKIPRAYFDDRIHKDLTYFCPHTGKFVTWADIPKFNYLYIGREEYDLFEFADFINSELKVKGKYIVLKLRELMQYFGTDICRKILGEDIWINITENTIKHLIEVNNVCYVSDVRYKNEADSICELDGRIIKIIRDESDDIKDFHDSEIIDINPHIIIYNNKSLANLFYQVLQITHDIL